MTIEGRQQWLAQQRQKREGICQDAALLNKYSNGTALTDEEKKRVQRLQKNAQQRKQRRKDTALLNKYNKKNAQPVTDEEEKRVRQLDTVQIKKHWMRQNRNTRAAEEDEYYSWRKMFLHKRWQDFIASIVEGEGGTYDAVGDGAYCERLLELENEYDSNLSLSLSAIHQKQHHVPYYL